MKFKVVFLFILQSFICSQLFAKQSALLQVRTIAVAPYGIESHGRLSGIYFDLTNSLLMELNLQNEHFIYPYARIMHELKIGKTDLTIMFKYKELEPFVEYIAPLPALKNVVIGNNKQEFSSIKSLDGKVIAYLRGAKFSDSIDNNPLIVRQEVADFNQGLILLKKGRVDAIIGPLAPIIMAAKKLKLTKDFFGEPLIVSQKTPWLQVSKKSLNKVSVQQLMNQFSLILENGELAKLKEEYQ